MLAAAIGVSSNEATLLLQLAPRLFSSCLCNCLEGIISAPCRTRSSALANESGITLSSYPNSNRQGMCMYSTTRVEHAITSGASSVKWYTSKSHPRFGGGRGGSQLFSDGRFTKPVKKIRDSNSCQLHMFLGPEKCPVRQLKRCFCSRGATNLQQQKIQMPGPLSKRFLRSTKRSKYSPPPTEG